MNLQFGKLIREIESHISFEYVPNAIQWCDEKYNYAWSNALNRFDKALALAIDRQEYSLAQMEGDFYKATILDLISKYKRFKNLDETEAFLSSIESGRNE